MHEQLTLFDPDDYDYVPEALEDFIGGELEMHNDDHWIYRSLGVTHLFPPAPTLADMVQKYYYLNR